MSGILSPSGAARAILELVRLGNFEVVTTSVLLDEVEEVLERYVSKAMASETRVAVEEFAEVVEPEEVPRVSRDPDDDHVIAAAVAGGVIVVATRDLDLLSLRQHEGIRFVEPAAFLAEVRQGSG